MTVYRKLDVVQKSDELASRGRCGG